MTNKYKRILVAVDESADSKLAFDYAITRAKMDNCSLNIASILEDNDFNSYEVLSKEYMNEQRVQLGQEMSDYKRTARNSGVKDVQTYMTEGDDEAGEIIIKQLIPEIKPDLLIIGSKSKSEVGQYFCSQASYMVRHSPISVLVVR